MGTEPVGTGCASCGDSIGSDWFNNGGNSSCGCGVPGDSGRPRCWLDCMGGIIYNSEFFVGSHAFQSLGLTDNSGFGFQAGFNTGMPLNWLTCGLLSGQFGISSSHSNFADNPNGAVNHQVFYTTGLFRRVDYGLQGGVVADVLDASWHFDPSIVQVRGELSWAWPGQSVLGFRFTNGVQDFQDPNNPDFNRAALDTYRVFYRQPACYGGFAEFEVGSTDDGLGVVGSNFDLAMSEHLALKSGFTYVLPDGDKQDAWNIFLGVSYRMRGSCWYEYYHRPMFDVADNGSLILTRGGQATVQ